MGNRVARAADDRPAATRWTFDGTQRGLPSDPTEEASFGPAIKKQYSGHYNRPYAPIANSLGNSPAQGPEFFTELGKPAKDLLTQGFTAGHMFLLTTTTPQGVVFTTMGTKVDDTFIGNITTSLQPAKGIKTEFNAGTANQLQTTVTWEDLAPGVKASLTASLPEVANGKAEIFYRNPVAALTGTVHKLTSHPGTDLSATFGGGGLSIGGIAGFDWEKNELTKFNAGKSFILHQSFNLRLAEVIHRDNILANARILTNFESFNTAATLDLMDGSTVDAYYVQALDPQLQVALHLQHNLKQNDSTMATLGGSYKMDPLTTLKARMDNRGIFGALVQHEFRPLSTVTISAELDTKKEKQAEPKVGVALALVA
eukprot:SM000042S15287  [mRNA]  locus=s42:87802:90442:+ [translate_table: standard]